MRCAFAVSIEAVMNKKIKKEINDVLQSVYEKDYLKVGTGDNIGGNLKKHLKVLNAKMKDSAA